MKRDAYHTGHGAFTSACDDHVLQQWTARQVLLDARSLLHNIWHSIQGLESIKALLRPQDSSETVARCIPLRAQQAALLVDERCGRPYISNSIRTSRYTIYDFIPKQFVFQATRLSNFYFIVIGIPQAIPGFSTTGNYTTILPLVFFMLLTVLKEGYDDLRRHRLDKIENGNTTWRYYAYATQELANVSWTTWLRRALLGNTPSQEHLRTDTYEERAWQSSRWRDIRVGDIIKVSRDEDFPADVVLLQTDHEDSVAYIESMALDGETNLKPRQASQGLRKYSTLSQILLDDISITAEHPNRDLYNFNGKITIKDEEFPLTPHEVVYRGSTLRNTQHAIGIVINTGEECKIRMNANHHPKAKKPRLEHYANQIVMILIVYVVLLSVGCSIGYVLWQANTEQESWYLNDAAVPFKQIIIGYGIMYNNVIPLALYVSLEIVKIGQMLLISSDIEMFDQRTNSPMRCNTNTILENLGQVGFVLSDKTGTLTENVMRFRGLSVGGHAWAHIQGQRVQHDEHGQISNGQCIDKKSPTVTVTQVEAETEVSIPQFHASTDRSPDTSYTTHELMLNLRAQPDSALARHANDLILAMAICNTCLPETSPDKAAAYQAASPDELALADAARDLGFTLLKRNSRTVVVRYTATGEEKHYEILDTIDFSSKRKRMSIILRCPDGRIWLTCKGADNVLTPRLRQADLAARTSRDIKRSIDVERERQRKSLQASRTTGRPSIAIERIRHSLDSDSFSASRPERHVSQKLVVPRTSAPGSMLQQHEMFEKCFQHIESYAVDGLRTLMFAHRYLTAQEYALWSKLYKAAATSLKDRQHSIDAVAEQIEQDMDLLGATAIEDKLQAHVPVTIEKLRRANIRIWMLTGDKRETAINIAHSAKICRPESRIYILDATKDDLDGQLHAVVSGVLVHGSDSIAVVDGYTLSIVEESERLTKLFFSITPLVSSVICCRASPAQKAFIVNAIHECVPRALTLAIGDGANDIAMIQAAHVGVGISGREGMQAARVADYSIAQFSYLQRLLLVHGRWNYIRTAKFVLWTFWKEMFFYMMQALYQQHTGYSGSSLYENWSLTALNTLFTSLCVILPGIFEQDLRAETLLTVPELYVYGQANQGLNLVGYLMWMVGAAIEGLLVWYVPWKLYGIESSGSDNGAFALGDLVFSLAIIWTNWKLLLIETHAKTKIVILGFSITVAGWWAWNVFLAGVYTSNLSPFDVRSGLFSTFGTDPCWWLTFVITLTMLALLDLFVRAVRRLLIVNGYWPLWRRGKEYRAQERELEAWQELEQEPGMIERLKARDISGADAY